MEREKVIPHTILLAVILTAGSARFLSNQVKKKIKVRLKYKKLKMF